MKKNSSLPANKAFIEAMEILEVIMKAISNLVTVIAYIVLIAFTYQQAPVLGVCIGIAGLLRLAYTTANAGTTINSAAVRAEVAVINLHPADIRARQRSKMKAA